MNKNWISETKWNLLTELSICTAFLRLKVALQSKRPRIETALKKKRKQKTIARTQLSEFSWDSKMVDPSEQLRGATALWYFPGAG